MGARERSGERKTDRERGVRGVGREKNRQTERGG